MSVEGVMVSYNHSGPEENANIITVSASGIKFSNRWVLTHGSILSPLKIAKDVHNSKGKPILNDRFYDNLPEMYITCERPKGGGEASSLQQHYDTLAYVSRMRSDPASQDTENHSYQVRVLTGRICHLWQCPVLDRCVDDILYSWTIGHRDADIEQQSEMGKTLLSVFVLIDLDSDVRDTKPLRPLSELLDAVRLPPDRGSRLQVHSTPFGCEVFLNCVTSGTVCGVVGARPSLLLTDASTALGSEGAPVYTHADDDGGGLIGMVVCSVSWWRGEWVGLTLVAPLKAVLNTKLRIPQPATTPAIVTSPELKQILRCIDSSTVLVRCGDTWGTGVYIGHGYVLTCAHVVKRHGSEKVSVYCGGSRATAILRYKTRDDNAYDLALLFTNPDTWPHLREARFATTIAVKGEQVVAVGYPYFNEKNIKDLKPTITSGHINNVSPSMIQTSCCVQSGFSGGAIFRLRREHGAISCEVVGIIVSNAKTQQTNACYPYINMAIPSHVFDNLLSEYLDTKSEEKLRVMESKKEIIQSQWRLLPYRSKI